MWTAAGQVAARARTAMAPMASVGEGVRCLNGQQLRFKTFLLALQH